MAIYEYRQEVVADQPTWLWPLDEPPGATEIYGYSADDGYMAPARADALDRNDILSPPSPLVVPGADGLLVGSPASSLYFPSTNIRLSYNPNFPTGPFAIEALVCPDVLSGTHTISSTLGYSGPYGWLHYITASGAVFFGTGGDFNTYPIGPTTNAGVINEGITSHVFAQYDGAIAYIYVDGVLCAVGDSPRVPQQGETLRFGSYNTIQGNRTGFFSGRQAYQAFYRDVNLSEDRIAEHAAAAHGLDISVPSPPVIAADEPTPRSVIILVSKPIVDGLPPLKRQVSVNGDERTVPRRPTFKLRQLSGNTDYEVKVRDMNALGWGDWSNTVEFTTPLATPTPWVERDGSDLVATWEEIDGAEGYLVRIDGGIPIDVGSDLTYTFEDPDLEAEHLIEVAAYASE